MVNAWVPNELPVQHTPVASPRGPHHWLGRWYIAAASQALQRWLGLGYTHGRHLDMHSDSPRPWGLVYDWQELWCHCYSLVDAI